MAKTIKENAIQWYSENRGLYQKLSEKITNILSELIEVTNLTIHAISNRAKDLDSFKKKIEDPKYDDPQTQITDFSGIRVIAYVEDDLKPICKIIEETFDIDIPNSSDKSDALGIDKVGYKSIHYVAKLKSDRLKLPEYQKFENLKFEIQVRTILQHAWAEIEHDKDYKFNGVLPTEIKRRFKILAGTLELVDREFNQLSKEIDAISDNVNLADKKNNLEEININTTTLKIFLGKRFKEIIDNDLLTPDFVNGDQNVIDELTSFGITNLEKLDQAIPSSFIQNFQRYFKGSRVGNYLGLLRDIMIIDDSDKYFEKCWKGNWAGMDNETIKFYKAYGVNWEETKEKYKIGGK